MHIIFLSIVLLFAANTALALPLNGPQDSLAKRATATFGKAPQTIKPQNLGIKHGKTGKNTPMSEEAFYQAHKDNNGWNLIQRQWNRCQQSTQFLNAMPSEVMTGPSSWGAAIGGTIGRYITQKGQQDDCNHHTQTALQDLDHKYAAYEAGLKKGG